MYVQYLNTTQCHRPIVVVTGGFATALFITPPKVSGSANGCFNGSSGVGVYGGGGPGILIASSNGKGSSEGNSSIKKKNEMEAYCS